MQRKLKGKGIKRILDILIILCGLAFIYGVVKETKMQGAALAIMSVAMIGVVWAIYDFFLLGRRREADLVLSEQEVFQSHGIQRLLLLDEQGKPVKSWDMQGRISLIIGKAGQNQELDIDLSDCEYSSFIDFQHAVLNFCLDQWYVEDLGSQNGVKVKKVEDGECYKVIHRPCKVVAGDILYIANTRLLLT